MSYDLTAIRNGLATALRTVPGLRAAPHMPDTISPPIAVIDSGPGNFETFEPLIAIGFDVTVLVSKAETRAAQLKLDAYMSSHTSQSIDTAIQNHPTLPYAGAATVDHATLSGWDSPAAFTVGGVEYYGVTFHVAVLAQ